MAITSRIHFPRCLNEAKGVAGLRMWKRMFTPRQEIVLVLTYWTAKLKQLDTSKLIVDLSKSFEHGAYRADGMLPAFLS